MDETLLETLPLSHRLALSYAPARTRTFVLALMALEQRLAMIVAGDGEPMIAQIKLAWWRDRLSENANEWPVGEPLFALLQQFPGDLTRWVPLVDGYETLLGETFDRPSLASYLRGKSLAWAALGDAIDSKQPHGPVEQASKEVAMHDLVQRLSDESEIELVTDALREQRWKRVQLSREMRPLAVLHALTRRAKAADRTELLESPRAMLVAIRVGITGR